MFKYDPQVEAELAKARVCRDAADYMEEHGHTKHQLVDDGGRVCLYGALLAAATGSPDGGVRPPAVLEGAAFAALGEVERLPGVGSAVVWNNMAERTQDDVVAALREAAALIEGRL